MSGGGDCWTELPRRSSPLVLAVLVELHDGMARDRTLRRAPYLPAMGRESHHSSAMPTTAGSSRCTSFAIPVTNSHSVGSTWRFHMPSVTQVPTFGSECFVM